jgi:hypothetical protein
VYFASEVHGTAAPYTLDLAWVDVPASPRVDRIAVQSTTVTYAYPSYHMLPGPTDGVFFTFADAGSQYPAGYVAPPIPPGSTIAMFRSPGAIGPMVAQSGGRLVSYSAPARFALVDSAGTAHAQAGSPVTPVSSMIADLVTFAAGEDGSVLFADTQTYTDCACSSAPFAFWLYSDAAATDPKPVPVQLDGQFNTMGVSCFQCVPFAPELAIAWINRTLAVTVATATEDRSTAAVRVISRDLPGAVPNRRVRITVDLALRRYALVSSAGMAYMVTTDTNGNDVQVRMLDPGCDATM